MVFRRRDAACALAIVVALAPCARAQSPGQTPADAQALRTAIDDLKKDFEQRLSALETRLAAVEAATKQGAATPAPPAVSSAPPATTGVCRIGDRRVSVERQGLQPGHGGHRQFLGCRRPPEQ